MRPLPGILGMLQPVGGGDPIPLTKPEMLIGRRPACDIRLDYENISRLINPASQPPAELLKMCKSKLAGRESEA